jgi:hypothetical protein
MQLAVKIDDTLGIVAAECNASRKMTLSREVDRAVGEGGLRDVVGPGGHGPRYTVSDGDPMRDGIILVGPEILSP